MVGFVLDQFNIGVRSSNILIIAACFFQRDIILDASAFQEFKLGDYNIHRVYILGNISKMFLDVLCEDGA